MAQLIAKLMRGSETSCYGRAVSSLEPALAKFKTVLLKRKGVALGVWGEAGIGKTYQARELLRNLPCRTLSLHATSSWTTLARSLPEAKKLPIWAERTLERLRRGESVETKQSLEALTALLATLAPMVVHLEDLHETNSERLESVQELGRRVQRSRGVGLLVTSRSEPPEPFETIRLGPLSREMSAQLLEREVAAELPKEALEWTYSKAAGNPLYTLEYLRFLSRQGFLWNDGKRWHWRRPEGSLVPASVEALIEFTLSDLRDERLETVLQTKAFLPLDADDELFQSVSELSMTEVEEAKRSLERRGIFLKGEFAHPLYREVTVKNLPKAKRQRFARRALEVLQDDPVKAVPFVDDALLDDKKALELLQRAIRQARELNDEMLAARLLAKAVHHASEEEKYRLAIEAARKTLKVNLETAYHLAEIAAGSPSYKLEAVTLMSELLAEGARLEEARQLLDTLPLSPTEKVKHLIRLHALAQDTGGVYTLIETQPEVLEGADTFTTIHYARALMVSGFREKADGILREALRQSNLTPDDRAGFLQMAAILAGTYGDSKTMEELLAQALTHLAGSPNLSLRETLLYNRATALTDLDRYEESRACFEEAQAIDLALGDILGYTAIQTHLAKHFHVQARYEQAEKLLLEAESYLQGQDPTYYLLYSKLFTALLYLDWQPLHGNILAMKYARAALDDATRLNSEISRADCLAALAQVELRIGQLHQALATAKEAISLYEQFQPEAKYQGTCVEARVLKALNHDDAVDKLQEAYSLTRQFGSAYQVHLLGLEIDHFHHDLESAKKRMQWFQERGLFNGVNITRRYFPELAEHPSLEPKVKNVPCLAVLGTMQLEKGQQVLNVRGRKRQDFFALLLGARMSGRSEVSRLDLFDLLYPDIDEEKATGNLRQLVHTLRLELGETVIKTTATGYTLGDITSDAEIFLQTLDTSLWRGCYLDGLDGATKESVQEALYLALFERAKQLLEDDSKETARLGRLLLEYDPYNADYLRLTLQALRKSDNHRTLGRVYEEAKTHFAELGETLPESWLGFVSSHSRV
jgi:tetratricopeptide (TPR) repeat protein